MINNYLDFVKERRKQALKESRKQYHRSLTRSSDWLRGYERGISTAYHCQADWWKYVQKDIEEHHSRDLHLAWADPVNSWYAQIISW